MLYFLMCSSESEHSTPLSSALTNVQCPCRFPRSFAALVFGSSAAISRHVARASTAALAVLIRSLLKSDGVRHRCGGFYPTKSKDEIRTNNEKKPAISDGPF